MARTAVRATISIPWKNVPLLIPYIPPLSLPGKADAYCCTVLLFLQAMRGFPGTNISYPIPSFLLKICDTVTRNIEKCNWYE